MTENDDETSSSSHEPWMHDPQVRTPAEENRTQTRGHEVRTQAREQRALDLRMAGATYREIAEVLGYADQRGPHNAVTRLLRRTDSRLADEYRDLHIGRLERALRAIWPQVLNGDLFAIDRAVRLLDREAKLLGLDAPTQLMLTDRTREQLTATVADLERMLLGPESEPPALTIGPADDPDLDDADTSDGSGHFLREGGPDDAM